MRCIPWIIAVALSIFFFQPAALAAWTPDNMMQVSLIKNVNVSPDGKKVAYTVQAHKKVDGFWEYNTQIYVTDQETHKAYQLTHEQDESTLPEWSPDGKFIAFVTKTNNGSNLKIIQVNGGTSWTIVQANAPIKMIKWSPSGTEIAYIQDVPASKTKVPQPIVFRFSHTTSNNLWLAHLDHEMKRLGNPEPLTHYTQNKKRGLIDAINWSPDSTYLIYTRFSPKTDAYWANGELTLINAKTKETRSIIKSRMVQHSPQFSPDGKQIAFLSDTRAYVVPVEGGTPTPLALTPDQLPQGLIGWSADSKHIYVQEYYHTYNSISSLETDGTSAKIINPPNKLILNISINANHTKFGFNMEDSNHAQEAYISDLEPFRPKRVSSVNANAPKFPLGVTEVIRWRSYDNKLMEGLLTYPVGYVSGKRYPLLIENHGGPGFSFQQYYTARQSVYPISVFASQGYLYFRPNIRGSSGYGPEFRNSIHKDWGGADLKDLETGFKHLVDIGIADPDKMGILGWSYGGYMGAWAVTQFHYFKAASLGGAITDLVSYAGTTDLADFLPNAFGGYFWNDPTLYLERSPIMHVKGVKTPTLLLNGALDYRVPPTQSEEFYRALKQQGVPSEVVLYPNTYHPIRIPYLVVDAAKRNVAWMNKYVKNNQQLFFNTSLQHDK